MIQRLSTVKIAVHPQFMSLFSEIPIEIQQKLKMENNP